MQTQKKVKTPAEEKFENLKAEFEAVKAKEIQPTKTKIINLVLISGCGCGGGNTSDIHIEVPEDYDEFSELEPISADEFKDIQHDGITIYDNHFYGDPTDEEYRDMRTEW